MSCGFFKQKGVMFVLPIICSCPSQILLAVCRVYTGCQCIYMCVCVCVIAYFVMLSVNTESGYFCLLRLCKIAIYLCGSSCVFSVKTVGQTLYRIRRKAVRTSETGEPGYLSHLHLLQTVVAL